MGRLLHREVRPEHLLSVEETEGLLARSRAARRTPEWRRTVEFAGKHQGLLARFVESFQSDPVYVWTPLTTDCGAHAPVRLSELDLGFPFDLNPEGILTVLAEDLGNRMLLDWYEEGGVELLDVEVAGARWGPAAP